MNNFLSLFLLLFLAPAALAGCEFIGNVFEAGVWVGVVLVIAVLGIIIWVISKAVR